jgi:flagellar M-ring protein FliF
VIRSEQRQSERSSGGTSLPEGAPEDRYQFGETSSLNMVSNNNFQKQNELINYEINRISKQIVGATGEIKRLSAAVVIDGTYREEKDADGTVHQVYVARSQEEIKRFEEIVKKAIGYNPDRGDQVEVINLAFAEHPDQRPEAAGGSPSWLKILERFLRPALKIVIALMVFLFVVRPLIRWLGQVWSDAGRWGGKQALELEHVTPEGLPAAGPHQQVRHLAEQDPEKTAELIKVWLNEEE